MRDKKNNRWLIGLAPQESRYLVNGVTYIVSSRFETVGKETHTLRSRFERLIKNNSADLSKESQGDIITAECVSTAHPMKQDTDRKEHHAEENSSQAD